jgi:tetratricopeptide (TPR) repeat protein
MEDRLLLTGTDVKHGGLVRTDHHECHRSDTRRPMITLLWLAFCAGLLTGMNPNAYSQILTKEDLQKQIAAYESASLHAKAPEMLPLQAGRIWSRLGTLYEDAGMYAQSERAYEHAMRLLSLAPVSQPDIAAATDNLGTLYMETGNLKEAERAESKALKIREDAGLKSDIPKSWYHLATLYLREHHPHKAQKLAQQAMSAFFADAGAFPEDKIGSVILLASSYCQLHQYVEAIPELQKAVHIAEQTYGAETFPAGFSDFLLGYAFWKNGDRASAGELMQRGTEIMNKQFGWGHPDYLPVMTQYARFLREEHRTDEARSIEEQVKRMRDQLSSNPACGHGLETTDVAALF